VLIHPFFKKEVNSPFLERAERKEPKRRNFGETAVSKSLDILSDFISANEIMTRHEGFRLVFFVFSWF
jgi:hypothetical protein